MSFTPTHFRVKTTAEARAIFSKRNRQWPLYGWCVGRATHGPYLKVRRDGRFGTQFGAREYHEKFWEAAQGPGGGTK